MDITDITGAGKVGKGSMYGGYGTGTGIGIGPGVSTGVKNVLDQVAADYVAKTSNNPRLPKVGSQKAQAQMQAAANVDPFAGLQLYESSGGPNWGAINSLKAQRDALQKNYETNRADAQNLYGTLSTDETGAQTGTGMLGDILTMGTNLQTAYTGAINESQTAAQGRQDLLSAEQARQQSNRERAAKELGIAPESILTSYGSDTALAKGMSDVAASAGSWEDLLRTNQTAAQQSTNQLVTATENTRNQTILGMKAYLDAQQAQIDAQISAEKAKTPTQKLTALGKLIESNMNQQIVDQLFPNQSPTPRGQNEQNAMRDLGLDPNNPNDMKKFRNLQASGSQKLSNKNLGSAPLTTEEQIAVDALGVPLAYFNPDYGLYGAGK